MSSLLTRPQKVLINFQRKKVIESSDTNFSSDEHIDDKFITQLKSENPMDRLFAVTKVKKLFKLYTKKTFTFEDPIDIKLIRGMYRRSTEQANYMKRRDS